MARTDEPELPTGTLARELFAEPAAWPLLPLADRWERGRPLVAPRELPRYVRTEVKLTVDADRWRIGFLAVHERELGGELFASLREQVPQALLRDLHRPVREFFATPEVVEGSEWRRVEAAYSELRAAARFRPELPTVEPLTRAVREEQQRRRAFLDERWAPIKPDDAPRAGINFYPASGDGD